jgi:hypothetical protein
VLANITHPVHKIAAIRQIRRAGIVQSGSNIVYLTFLKIPIEVCRADI